MGKREGRDRRGRFAPGNRGGPGRPRRATEAGYLKALAGIVSLDDLRAIARRAVADAKKGSARAREWVSAYLLGVPVPRSRPGPDDRQRAMIAAVREEMSGELAPAPPPKAGPGKPKPKPKPKLKPPLPDGVQVMGPPAPPPQDPPDAAPAATAIPEKEAS